MFDTMYAKVTSAVNKVFFAFEPANITFLIVSV